MAAVLAHEVQAVDLDRAELRRKDQETVDRLAAQPLLERLGTPADIAAVTAFLAGPDGRWINGQILRANGGIN
ncbi:SDR family oxidoreductase [Saccharopolyspora sp. NPDC049357]|uniref:SDR family oxidoreductase n=1 Tax=Saccharopolyspora sp. NPDC049357 TaxID=3154507 RepID=UPI003448853D